MWNMPSMDMPGALMVTVPACQNPFIAVWLRTELLVFMAGPMGVAGMSPVQLQLPSNILSRAISGAGLGMGMAALAGFSAGFAAGFGAGAGSLAERGRAAGVGRGAGSLAERGLSCASVHGAAASVAAARTPIMERVVIFPPEDGRRLLQLSRRAQRARPCSSAQRPTGASTRARASNTRRPSAEPRPPSAARSGWGMRPTTLRAGLHTPAMACAL